MEHVFAGVDPGIVNTGVVVFKIDVGRRKYRMSHAVVLGLSGHDVAAALETLLHPHGLHTCQTYIELYRPRSAYQTDQAMMTANSEIKAATQGTLLRNNGVTKIVSKDLLEVLGAWSFPVTTHHQDLRSAARIGVLGALLHPPTNRALYDFVSDMAGSKKGSWDVDIV